ncbi:MAG: hypothetical protein JSR76_03800 [Verrucomicrobia bacterium]|nr:hypothetical protein [Verrucomicrobiota bacterium]
MTPPVTPTTPVTAVAVAVAAPVAAKTTWEGRLVESIRVSPDASPSSFYRSKVALALLAPVVLIICLARAVFTRRANPFAPLNSLVAGIGARRDAIVALPFGNMSPEQVSSLVRASRRPVVTVKRQDEDAFNARKSAMGSLMKEEEAARAVLMASPEAKAASAVMEISRQSKQMQKEHKLQIKAARKELGQMYEAAQLARRAGTAEFAVKETVAALGAVVAERDAVVAERDAVVAERDAAVAECDAVVVERDAAVAERDAAVAERDAAVAERDAALADQPTGRIAHLWRVVTG